MTSSTKIALRRASRKAHVPTSLAIGALLIASVGARSTAFAQRPDMAWYRVVNSQGSAGTMPRYQRVGEGYTGTFPFMEGFEIRVRAEGDRVTVGVVDGTSISMSAMSCTRPDAPRRISFIASRSTQGSARIAVDVLCSATEPPVR